MREKLGRRTVLAKPKLLTVIIVPPVTTYEEEEEMEEMEEMEEEEEGEEGEELVNTITVQVGGTP